ncbi:hypothetical protein [Actinospica robiniae]|uniref:hypothetical protein n=1 Tax=Actinospica robiniae TaxID=304901 RepID=UPI000403C92D|nr:hypothetical protein [Actinospica robiniae]
MSEEQHYREHRLADLEVIDILWPDWAIEHIQTRTARHPGRDELDLYPEWATEAALEEYRRFSISAAKDLRVIGWSRNAPAASWSTMSGRVLRVVIKPVDIDEGLWRGVTAMPASENAAAWYWRQRGGFSAA